MTTAEKSKNTESGVKPDLEIKPSLSDILENRDVAMKQFMTKISNEK